ncbi:MAG: peptidoglycan endopeptidase, partial [Ramlibacter sp.]
MLLLRLLPTVALVAALSVQAAPSQPPGTQEDELQRFMADKGLMDKLGQVRSRISATTSELVVTAMGFLGVPYRRGGNTAETGFD